MRFRLEDTNREKWKQEYEVFKKKYGDLLSEFRGKNYLIVLIGPRAVGKTYAIEKLISEFGSRLKRIKNFTTRQPRNEQDKKYYYFVSKDQFLERLSNFDFLEHDEQRFPPKRLSLVLQDFGIFLKSAVIILGIPCNRLLHSAHLLAFGFLSL